jgi:epoxyqueuosine reductase
VINQLLQEVKLFGYELVLIPVERLNTLKVELERFQKEEELNGFQRWIVEELYHYEVPVADFTIRSILLVALAHPPYAEVELNWNGSVHKALSLVMPDFDAARERIIKLLEREGYHCSLADHLPLKRMAVQSGLSKYGRNNITYIDGMGSNFSYDAFFTDLPCDEDYWMPVTIAASCTNCKLCIRNCPTGAIRSERYLIDNQRCLSAMNEIPGEFPGWLSPSVHHTMYDCLRCQEVCPMNREAMIMVPQTFTFSEEETQQLLDGAPYEAFSSSMKSKTKILGLDSWLPAIPRNLRLLLEQSIEKTEVIS